MTSVFQVRKTEGDDWVPILAQPSVCQEYSQSNPASLHEKSLLELGTSKEKIFPLVLLKLIHPDSIGEDRFLSTLMIRNFPRRKMMFCSAAKCKTLVPDTFSVLLSQRRRWICSSIHNLIELLQVPNLCGVFCCSMSFIVLLE
jgi:chitin synthase